MGGEQAGAYGFAAGARRPGRPPRPAVAPSAASAASAEQIAWGSVPIGAIRSDPGWRGGDSHDAPRAGGPHRDLGQAPRIALVTYRGEPELGSRSG